MNELLVNEKKKVFVLLTRGHTRFSNFLYWISGRGYTHASISIDETGECFYSFNFSGFCEEHPFSGKKRKRESVCYQFEISKQEYCKIEEWLTEFIRKKGEYRYSRLGVALCIMKIPNKRKKAYFCSQFVAELLNLMESFKLRKRPSLYLPNQFVRELACHPALCRTVYQGA